MRLLLRYTSLDSHKIQRNETFGICSYFCMVLRGAQCTRRQNKFMVSLDSAIHAQPKRQLGCSMGLTSTRTYQTHSFGPRWQNAISLYVVSTPIGKDIQTQSKITHNRRSIGTRPTLRHSMINGSFTGGITL